MTTEKYKENFKQEFIRRLIKYSVRIIKFCTEIRSNQELRAIADQLIRSGPSIGANYSEAQSSSSKKEYIRYFEICLKSANESKYWLILVRQVSDAHREKASELLKETEELAKIIASSIRTMRGQNSI